MGLFSRKGRNDRAVTQDAPPSAAAAEPAPPVLPDDGRPVTAPLTETERSRIAAALEALAAQGVDVDDVRALGDAYDRASAAARTGAGEGSEVVVELFGVALGEHLVRHSAREWAVVTDVFGTDLGVAGARTETVIVPHNLVSARWMRDETGWVPGVLGHLVRLQPRA